MKDENGCQTCKCTRKYALREWQWIKKTVPGISYVKYIDSFIELFMAHFKRQNLPAEEIKKIYKKIYKVNMPENYREMFKNGSLESWKEEALDKVKPYMTSEAKASAIQKYKQSYL